ncbi:MAG: hypothetical protein R3B41_00860 [Candidatus Doudnabacteria bacterium]
MRPNVSVRYVYIKSVWSDHPEKFYQKEALWLLQNLSGRLRKRNFRPDETEEMLWYLFETEWFNSVKRGRGALILERKRGRIFFVVRLEDIPKIRRLAIIEHRNKRWL